MKLLSLDLLAYGPFTDVHLDLAAGNAGLHVIYGPNEAGKSSALRALEALLFGIPARTTDNFRHENAQLRIGGSLQHIDGSCLSIIRRKGNKSTLLTPDNDPLEDRVLETILGGMDRERFTRLFGIDHLRLHTGGQELMQLGGEVGQSLFSASLGGVPVRARLQALDDEAESLFQPRGQKMTINILLKRYEEARERMRKTSLSGNEWQQQDKQVNILTGERQTQQAAIADLMQQQARMQRLAHTLSDLATRRGLLEQQAALGEVQLLPLEFPEDYQQVQGILTQAKENAVRAAGTITVLEERLTNLAVPDALLAMDAPINDLHLRLGEYEKAQRDQTRLAGELAQLQAEIHRLVQDFPISLTLEVIQQLHVPQPVRKRLRSLADQAQAITARQERADQDERKFTREHHQALADLEACPPIVDCQALKDALTRAGKLGDIEEAYRRAESNRTAALMEAERALARLTGWNGTLESAELLPVPAEETILRFASKMKEADSALADWRQRVKAFETDLEGVAEELDAMQRTGDVPTESDLTEARSARDANWQQIKQRWIDLQEDNEASVLNKDIRETFERDIAHADLLADRLRREADRVAKQATLLARQARCECDLSEANSQLTLRMESCGQVLADWQQIWDVAQITPLSPEEMRAWRAQLQQLLAVTSHLRTQEREVQNLSGQIADMREAISRELTVIDALAAREDESYSALLDRAQALVNRHLAAAQQCRELEKRQHSTDQALKDAREELARVQEEHARWQTDWQAAVAPLQLPGTAVPADVDAFLEALKGIHDKLDKAEGLQGRIDGIDHDAHVFMTDVTRLLEQITLPWGECTVQQVVADLHARLLQAREDAATRKGWQEQLAEQQETHRKALVTQTLQEQRLKAMCQQASCETPVDLPAVITRSQDARRLKQELARCETNLQRFGEIPALEAEASDVDPDNLPAQLDETAGKLEELNTRLEALKKRLWEAQAALDAMDGAPEAAEAAELSQSILAELRAPVDRFMRLRLTARLIREAIEQYRTANQSPLLERAGAIFSHLTLGAYQAVKVDFNDEDDQILKAVRTYGGDVDVTGMSDGTRDQLYLALRIASLERYLSENPPMPFVVDDILITFDDERAAAALAVLAELARKTQVVFFTHHQRLADIAHSLNQPDAVFIQELGVVPVG